MSSTGPASSNYRVYLELLKYIHKGDWEAARDFNRRYPDSFNVVLSPTGMTALHMATVAGHVRIVENLIDLMSADAMELKDGRGLTALSYAAGAGNIEMVRYMIDKNKRLATITTGYGYLPVVVAGLAKHPDTARYLFSKTPVGLESEENIRCGSQLLRCAINCRFFDIADHLLHVSPQSALAADHFGINSLYTLSKMPDAFYSGCQLSLWQQWIYSCIPVELVSGRNPSTPNNEYTFIDTQSESRPKNIMQRVLKQCHGFGNGILKLLGVQKIYEMKMTHVHSLNILHRICEQLSTIDVSEYGIRGVYVAVNNAARNGIVEFITKIAEVHPELPVFTKDENQRDIIMDSVVHRQEKIYGLVHGIGDFKSMKLTLLDEFNNNLLHLAGMLSPPSQLNRISGAALQMQRELQWYKEVESNVPPLSLTDLNSDGETPWQVFTSQHKNLAEEAEKWMKGTATSCTVVAALIVTIMFTAAFTIPGGNVEGTGLPKFLGTTPFTTFIVSDAISLFASSTSVLMFLAVLTSRYAEVDFLKSLPTKLIIGLSMLFISIAAMMIAFSATLFLMLDGQLRLVVPIVLVASVPVTLFLLLQFPLLVEIFMSTYGRSIFDRKIKRWY